MPGVIGLVGPTDRIDLVELNDSFVEQLRRRFQHEPAFLAVAGFAMAADDPARSEVDLLRRQVVYLAEALAKARADADAARARLDRREFEKAGAGATVVAGVRPTESKDWKILDVNKDLGMAVLSAGRDQGVRSGMRLAALEKNRPVAELRVVDVRAGIAGAVIETTAFGVLPKAEDRVIVAKGSTE